MNYSLVPFKNLNFATLNKYNCKATYNFLARHLPLLLQIMTFLISENHNKVKEAFYVKLLFVTSSHTPSKWKQESKTIFYSHKTEKRKKLRRTGCVNSSNRLTGASNNNTVREAENVQFL